MGRKRGGSAKKRGYPQELGDLIEVHRPMRGYTGWIACLAFPTVILVASCFAAAGPLVGLILFVLIGVPVLYATAEWFLLEHRIYRHGIVFRSLAPGLKTYVVPYYTCEADGFSTLGRRVHDGEHDIVNRRYRQCPFTRTNINMPGINTWIAGQIGSGKEPWTAGFESNPPVTLGGRMKFTGGVPKLDYQDVWLFSSRTPQHHIDLLSELITADHKMTRPRNLKRRGVIRAWGWG